MNSEMMKDLCKMIANTYKLGVYYYDSEGIMLFSEVEKKEQILNGRIFYIDNFVIQCINLKEIRTLLNECGIIWIGIPYLSANIVTGVIVIGPFFIKQVSDKSLLESIQRMSIEVKGHSPLVGQACAYMKAHVYENMKVSSIANYLNISYGHLSRIFHCETGEPIVNYIKEIKINEAKFFLKYTNYTFVEISEKLSFGSQSYFHTVFKGVTGTTPKQFKDSVKINS